MPVVYVNLKKQESLTKEPYVSFLKKYNTIKDDLNGEQIELRVGGKDGCYANGFYIDNVYYKNPRLKIDFASITSHKDGQRTSVFIRFSYSYEGEDIGDFNLHLQRVKDIKKRAPYYYIPGASHFEFSSQIDDEYKLLFDVLVEDLEKVSEVCCSMISLIITIFSLDN